MKTMKLYIKHLLPAIILIIANACTSNIEEDLTPEPQKYKLILNCSKPSYDDSESTRAGSSHNWKTGDKLFIQFFRKNSYNEFFSAEFGGVATYKDGMWDIDFAGRSLNSKIEKCEVWYLDGEYNYTYSTTGYNSLLYPEATCCVYLAEANYSIKDSNIIEIEASLKPLRYRVRFEGEKNKKIIIKGFCTDNHHDTSSPKYYFDRNFLYSSCVETPTITTYCTEEINGKYYTPYLYGGFPRYYQSYLTYSFLSLKIDDNVFARWDIPAMNTFPNPTISNTIVCPTESNHENWAMDKYKSETLVIPAKDNFNSEWIELPPFNSKTGINVSSYIDNATYRDEDYSPEIYFYVDAQKEIPEQSDESEWIGAAGWSIYSPEITLFYRGISKANLLGGDTKYCMQIHNHYVKASSITLDISNF